MKNINRKLSPAEMMAGWIVYIVISASAAWLFYDSIIMALVFLPFGIGFLRMIGKLRNRKHVEELTEEFIKSLISVSTSLGAGMSPENAFITAAADMEKLYGKSSVIVQELQYINLQVSMGIRLQDALFDFAERAGTDEIYDFAMIFSVAKEKGGDFVSVISSCVSIMENRREAESEAHVLIRAKQYEQRVMCIIPPGILLYLRISSGSFIKVLYHNAVGYAVMTICLAVYVMAICLAEKIGDIKV